MIPNGVLSAVSNRRLLSASIAAAAVAAMAVAWLLLGSANLAQAAAPRISVSLNGDRLTAEVSNSNEVDVDSGSWEWISYNEADADADTSINWQGCVSASFGLSGSDTPDVYNSGTGSSVRLTSADNGLTYCFMVANTDGETNTKKYPGNGEPAIDISDGSSSSTNTNTNANTQANSAESNAGGKQAGAIPDSGIEEDLLLGGLFILGVTASVACSKIWLDTYRRQRQPKA
ncbi:hypothetical protein F4X86_04780 [Candidatus Saccharibacteria bacterium]|nr:hypothetical protein [Candidatus Saccharibacteria bacterium]